MNDPNNYIESDEERDEVHIDTRERNFKWESKDPHIGCDMGFDFAG